jgi:hypothetical protein
MKLVSFLFSFYSYNQNKIKFYYYFRNLFFDNTQTEIEKEYLINLIIYLSFDFQKIIDYYNAKFRDYFHIFVIKFDF